MAVPHHSLELHSQWSSWLDGDDLAIKVYHLARWECDWCYSSPPGNSRQALKFYCTTPSCPVHIELCPHRRYSDPPPTIRSINLAHSHALTAPSSDVQVNMREEQERRKDQVKRNGLERLKWIHDAVRSRVWPAYLRRAADLQNVAADIGAALGTNAWTALKEEARVSGIWTEEDELGSPPSSGHYGRSGPRIKDEARRNAADKGGQEKEEPTQKHAPAPASSPEAASPALPAGPPVASPPAIGPPVAASGPVPPPAGPSTRRVSPIPKKDEVDVLDLTGEDDGEVDVKREQTEEPKEHELTPVQPRPELPLNQLAGFLSTLSTSYAFERYARLFALPSIQLTTPEQVLELARGAAQGETEALDVLMHELGLGSGEIEGMPSVWKAVLRAALLAKVQGA